MQVDLLIRDVDVYNSYLKKFVRSNAAVSDGKFLYIGKKDADELKPAEVIEGKGRYMVPGLIDIHLHIESSMVTPLSFSHELVKNGVTTVVAEPHEIANVFGVEGIIEMIKADSGCEADIFYGVPSSVPSTDNETAGAEIGIAEFKELMGQDKVVCLGEVMNYMGVIRDKESKINKLLDFVRINYPGLIMEGHCPKISGFDLAKFIYAGIDSDHTQQTIDGMEERIMNGMFVEVQEKSINKEILDFIMENEVYEHFCFATDDVMADSFIKEGHLNKLVKKAIFLGMKPEIAVYGATFTPARRMGLKDRGSIAPGKIADFILLDDLNSFSISQVYKKGNIVFDNDKDYDFAAKRDMFPEHFYKSVNLQFIEEQDVMIKAPVEEGNVKCRIMNVTDGTTFTGEVMGSIEVKGGYVDWENSTYCLIAVFERHGKNGNAAFGFITGDTIKRGAVATTYAHDHHNLLVIGKNAKDIVKAANTIIECQGGYCVVEDGFVAAKVELPVAGILSEEPLKVVGEKLSAVKEAMRKLGYNHYNPVMSLSTNTLPVSPELKITDRGLVKVSEGQIVNLFLEV